MFKIESLVSDVSKKVQDGLLSEFVKISKGSEYCVMTKKYAEICLERIKNFKVFEDDIWLVSFPKAGSTWTRQTIKLIENNFDIEKSLEKDFEFIE